MTERFEKKLKNKNCSLSSLDVDALKVLTVPTVESNGINCKYFIEVKLSFIGGAM